MQRLQRSGVIPPDSWANFPVTPSGSEGEGSGAEEADDMNRTEPWDGRVLFIYELWQVTPCLIKYNECMLRSVSKKIYFSSTQIYFPKQIEELLLIKK